MTLCLCGAQLRPSKPRGIRKSCDRCRKNKHTLKNIRSGLRRHYGITIEQYDEMFEQQKGCCAICGGHQSAFRRRLAVDHDYRTKKVRQLLCGNCNTGLGKFMENEVFLRNAILYLNSHNSHV